MSEDLEAIQASLKRLLASKDADAQAHAKALTVAMHGVQAALAELLAMSESGDDEKERAAFSDAADRIAQAIGGIQLNVPPMEFNPNISVEAPQVTVAAPNVTVQAPQPAVNQITIEAQPERDRPIRYEIYQEIVSGHVTGKTIVTPIYR